MTQGQPQSNKPSWKTRLWYRFKFLMGVFFGSLVATGIIMPIVAALVTVILYLAFSDTPISPILPILQPFAQTSPNQLNNNYYILINGAIITFCLWMVAIPFCGLFATVENANTRSYGGLRNHLSELEAYLGIKEVDYGETELDPQNQQNITNADFLKAKEEAQKGCANIVKYLWQHHSGISWVFGTDYINMWEAYHRAEEALITILTRPELIGEMRHDQLAIKNASIGNQEELLSNLQQALVVLNPEATTYFRECQSGEICQAVEELKQTIDYHKVVLKKLSEAFKKINPPVVVEISVDGNSCKATEGSDADKEARMILRQVRRALNEYRTNLWENLLETRNQLLWTIALAGIVTYVLLFLSIMAKPSSSNIFAAVVFYVVGALTGLAGRFYKELESTSTLVGDYHLSLVRLITVPLLSGLAGIGGVLIATMLTAWGAQNQGSSPITIEAIFSLQPGFLLIAAVFGMTPNLLIQSLKKRADKYASDLESSQAERPKTDEKNAGGRSA